MSEMSDMFKLVNQMELAKKARVGMELTYFDVIELLGELKSLYEYIAELEAENIRLGIEYQRMRLALGDIAINSKRALNESPTDQLTARWRQERQDDKLPEREVCEACGGDGTVLLTDGYEGQVMATAKCIYCNGTGRVNKECEE